jgi:fructosamine-3-kinase
VHDELNERVEDLIGERPVRWQALRGGCIAQVYRLTFASRAALVVKHDPARGARLDVEADMLDVLAADASLPVPRVVAAAPDVLVMELIEADGQMGDVGRVTLAESLASMHAGKRPSYGFPRDTLIGPLNQPNQISDDWPAFFAAFRVRHFADVALRGGRLCGVLHTRCHRLADRLGEDLAHGVVPALVHGDLWSGNVLWNGGHLAAVIDPALYWADREVELAFMDLMGGFGAAFWDCYESLLPIESGFWERRRLIYQLYPLLIHVHWFGGSYERDLEERLDALGT